ncbi:hypothetical protein [Rhizobium sp.]|uniref:hypothetical protein n=1 Tax=Rhizobium sp. TaxID=391 RepID=UPI003F7E38B5
MQTLLLDQELWDLTVDTAGNIAVASNPYSQAQDAASAIRTFEGEVFYDTTLGIPYFTQILGYAPPTSLMKAYFNSSALTVPGVTKAQTFITSWQDRVLQGQVQIQNEDGQVSATGF